MNELVTSDLHGSLELTAFKGYGAEGAYFSGAESLLLLELLLELTELRAYFSFHFLQGGKR